MDNSDTKKEAVSRTYQRSTATPPIALYLGNEGWNLGLEPRAGSQHSALETEYFFERAFPRLRRVCAADAKLLWRADSGFDSADCCSRWPTSAIAGPSSGVRSITSPSGTRAAQDKAAWVARAEAAGVFDESARASGGTAGPDRRARLEEGEAHAAPGGAGDRAHDRQEGPAPAHPEIESKAGGPA